MQDFIQTEATPFNSDSVNQWFSRGEYKTIDNHQLFIIDEADENWGDETTMEIDDTKPVLVYLHGFPTSSFDIAKLWDATPALKQQFRLITLDLLGFGFSSKPNMKSYSIHQQSSMLESVLEKHGISEAHLLAHDYGVSIAQELIVRQEAGTSPIVYRSCCFLNGGLFPETHRPLLIQKLLLSPIGGLISRWLIKYQNFKSSFSDIFGPTTRPTEEELTEFWELIDFNQGRLIFHRLIHYIKDRKVNRERWVNALISPELPLAVINGSTDPVSGKHMVTHYRNLGCRLDYLAELPNIGHYPQLEASDEVASHYLAFIEQITNTS